MGLVLPIHKEMRIWANTVRMGGILVLALLAGPHARGATGPVTSLRALHGLSGAEAAQALPVRLQATVIYYDNKGVDLFVEDGDLASYIFTHPGEELIPGDRILVEGKTHMDFRPDVVDDKITVLGHRTPPRPVDASFGQLIRAQLDCMRVRVRAQVRSADIVRDGEQVSVYLHLLVDGGYIEAAVVGDDERFRSQLPDAQVEITGAVAGKFDSKMQLAGIVLEVQGPGDVTILRRAHTPLESLPLTPMDQILKGYRVLDRTQRVRVQGSVTYDEPGTAVVLQKNGKSLWVVTQYEGTLPLGEVVDATGFPDVPNGTLTLNQSQIYQTHRFEPVNAVAANYAQLAPGKHAFDLVSIEGRVLAAVRGAAQDEYILQAGGHLFSAIYRHPDLDGAPLPAMKAAPVGSMVRVTGVCRMKYGSDPLGSPVAFEVLLRSFDDLSVIARPSWLNVGNLVRLVSVLLVVVMGVGLWGWMMRRKVQQQTAEMAKSAEAEAIMERRRSQILEDINTGRPLAEVLEQIASLVSCRLGGAPCWCQVADGARLGKCPESFETRDVIRQEIPSRSGGAHGGLYVYLNQAGGSQMTTGDALAMGAWLASVAIETRRLYSDLVHRSEYDLLTDIYNRFSLEQRLEAEIKAAKQYARILGLIYLDLDDFKQVNDLYGHQAGDLYLQEVASRMKRQVRPSDMLARLGGDEFAALVATVRNRTEVEEIADRLKQCFADPFVVDGKELVGQASVGTALYPEDAGEPDGLLKVADARMYASKQAKHCQKRLTSAVS